MNDLGNLDDFGGIRSTDDIDSFVESLDEITVSKFNIELIDEDKRLVKEILDSVKQGYVNGAGFSKLCSFKDMMIIVGCTTIALLQKQRKLND